MRMLVVEDEPKIAGFLSRGLIEEGHQVTVAGTLAAARSALATAGHDLLIIDRMLPDGDGLALIRELREAGNGLPALCVTAKDRVEDRVQGLWDGADDYLVKPFAFEELLARIAAIARRRPQASRILRVADLTLDAELRTAKRGEREVPLTPQEFALLWFLAEHPGRVHTRAELLAHVWNVHHDPGTNVVDVYMGYLRRKIDRDAAHPLVHTVRGVGYLLRA